MIAPIRPPDRSSTRLKDRRGVHKARRWIARSFLSPGDAPRAPSTSARAAWATTAWMLFVAGAYFTYLALERFGRD